MGAFGNDVDSLVIMDGCLRQVIFGVMEELLNSVCYSESSLTSGVGDVEVLFMTCWF